MNHRRIIVILGIVLRVCSSALCSEEAGSVEEKISIWGGYSGEAVWVLVWFVLLLAVLWKFAWKPLLAGLRGREEHIEKQISDAEKTRSDAQKTLQEYRSQLADADRQGRELISQRMKEAETAARDLQSQSQMEIERMKVRAEAELERGRIEAEEELWDQAGEIIQRLGREVFSKALEDEDHQRLIREAIQRLKEAEKKNES